MKLSPPNSTSAAAWKAYVESFFTQKGIKTASVVAKEYPEETIFIVHVPAEDFARAVETSSDLDQDFSKANYGAFCTIRKSEPAKPEPTRLASGVRDARALAFADLLTSRARTSEAQPSLAYIPDAAGNISTIRTPRHHLVFGRRGAGKTSLLVEAKRVVDAEGDFSIWQNIQTLRREPFENIFLWIIQKLISQIVAHSGTGSKDSFVRRKASTLREEVEVMLGNRNLNTEDVARLVPHIQLLLQRFLTATQSRYYLFIDDLHYCDRSHQPNLLDLLHGVVRDTDAWLKVASIRHLSRWFISSPPTGLQTGHDADHIDLDLTLESPNDAKAFLEELLLSYAREAGIASVAETHSKDALNRLVLASGAVPRDYMVLAASSIREARKRTKAKSTGVQDVNRAAGTAAKVKVAELEDDTASSGEPPDSILSALQRVRTFCLEEKACVFFKIDFRDKEANLAEYNLIQALLDLRLLHLISSSLSDTHRAGHKYEVYMLDLSQFSGERLKKHIKVLDFQGRHLVLKKTGRSTPPRLGDTPRKLLTLLRSGPVFELTSVLDQTSPTTKP